MKNTKIISILGAGTMLISVFAIGCKDSTSYQTSPPVVDITPEPTATPVVNPTSYPTPPPVDYTKSDQTPPRIVDRTIVISPGFGDPKIKFGYLNDEESEYDYENNCNEGRTNITPNREPDHIAILKDDFDKSIITVKVKTLEEVNPWILIKAVGEENIICEQDDESDLTYFSHQATDTIKAGIYMVWIGDTEENNDKILYKVEVTEEPTLEVILSPVE
ncbi:hypothetical protein [Okeania sp. SIO2B3]|uniref:hypothetical protein n=1 Tax=Okeania sp. SIO2B3 TaxID=2607784 RepID=UPI0013BFC6EE|nr:hypothetical protein [Okeania sp. SIO2B3]NET43319.1 hypothetical protein [Okeania sp. SIO2B3]